MGEPSWGLWKRTPSSVMWESLRRETIWNLDGGLAFWPESDFPTGEAYMPATVFTMVHQRRWVQLGAMGRHDRPVRMLCGHDWNLWAPPSLSRTAWPGLRPLLRCQRSENAPDCA